ncbi:hypothetical protein CONCODRAFT_9763 [Conidiobolus coronatus NRRL 28638]|uniref:Uncharacterized protein n=1 Tax=Conidiobolus coronatus (strain ATCC 28846 / CBS 209.66 / NRRL 28638) TaxID=796925 RepID=A0A137NZB4_CONC2|nr:hypothetical protein CONCODRAFT_9763 [Conidiobolus coronatus NRRL 28638]|eukprot:KXN68038.1 hypothetical protein CONCODRAFT_9763 [Conidiobolus coronatus NRRL 28638]
MGNMSSKNKERKERKNRESEMKIWMKSKIDKHSQDLLDGETFMIIAPSEDLCMTRKDVDKIPGRGYYWFEDGEEPCCVSRVVSIENDGQREFTIMALQKDACVQSIRGISPAIRIFIIGVLLHTYPPETINVALRSLSNSMHVARLYFEGIYKKGTGLLT